MNINKYLFNRQYRLFRKKIRDVQTSIWEHEFKIAKGRQVREGVRQDRERAMESLHQIETMLKSAQNIDPEKITAIEAEKTKLQENVDRYEKQMKMVDDQIQGVPPNGEDAGQTGLMDVIRSLVELKGMYEDYASKL